MEDIYREMKPSPASSSTLKPYSTAVVFFLILLLPSASGFVHLHGSSFSFTFVDAPAQFAVPINPSGICGSLHVADPIDACFPLRTNFSSADRNDDQSAGDRFVLIERGRCSFDRKVRVAQDAGFDAAIVFDDRNMHDLYSMTGNSIGVHIHAVFVSKSSGEILRKYTDGKAECCMGPRIEENVGIMLVMSFISVIVIISAIAVVIFARNWLILRNAGHRRNPCMERREVELIPHFIFKRVHSNNKCAVKNCAICLEDYEDGQRIRLLPCHHDFHSACVDSWLTKWGTFCPICKFQLYG